MCGPGSAARSAPASCPTAVEQARSAASVAAARPEKAVHRFDDLGVLRLLASLAGGPELARYIEDELGALLKHDARPPTRCCRRLRTYLSCDGNKSQAAQQLYVQRRTLYYRLERIERLLGPLAGRPGHPSGADLRRPRTRPAAARSSALEATTQSRHVAHQCAPMPQCDSQMLLSAAHHGALGWETHSPDRGGQYPLSPGERLDVHSCGGAAVADCHRSTRRSRHRHRDHRFRNGRRHARLRAPRCGAEVLIIEQGDFLPVERENWSFDAVHTRGDTRTPPPGTTPRPAKTSFPATTTTSAVHQSSTGPHCHDFRECDFGEIEHVDGISPAWPISYADLEPFYGAAEHMFWVHATKDEDPTDPWRSTDYPFPGLPHEGAMARLVESAQQARPAPVCGTASSRPPARRCLRAVLHLRFLCVHGRRQRRRRRCRRAAGAEAASKNVRLLTNAEVTRLGHRQRRAHGDRSPDPAPGAAEFTVRAKRFVVACGAVNTAALLLRSHRRHTRGDWPTRQTSWAATTWRT